MFKRATIVAALLLLGAGLLLAWSLTAVDADAWTDYQKLVQQSVEQRQIPPGTQLRRGVSKDLWLVESGQRLHSHLESAESTVEFVFHGHRPEIREQMEAVEGQLQDELFYQLPDGREVVATARGYQIREGRQLLPEIVEWDLAWRPMQEVRQIEAKEATFCAGRFCGSDVSMSRFRTEGHELGDFEHRDELLSGRAEGVEFSIGKRQMDFRASRLRATIFSPKGMI